MSPTTKSTFEISERAAAELAIAFTQVSSMYHGHLVSSYHPPTAELVKLACFTLEDFLHEFEAKVVAVRQETMLYQAEREAEALQADEEAREAEFKCMGNPENM